MHGFIKRGVLSSALLLFPIDARSSVEPFAFNVKQFYLEQCAECHGSSGIGSSERYPNVAGQKRAYMIKEMKDFQSGHRPGTIMPSVMEGITEKEIESLATYMSKLTGRP